MNKIKAGFRLSAKCKEALVTLSQKLGISLTSVVEMAIRKLAETEKVKVD